MNEVLQLRLDGNSYGQIARTLGISKSTVAYQVSSHAKFLASQRRIRRRKLIKQQAVAYKGGKCIRCGYDRCIAALEFHHRDPSMKEFLITGSGKSFEAIKPELDKTDLVCANCHREIESD